ncbi:MAG: hypothetical protein OEQ18_00715 [Gammaproteobacteria bacterium]|nr:hypothetical protein [Gammaproteobacteria bacterium]
MANWLTTVEGISIANGYNTDLGHVQRFRAVSMAQEDNILIEIKQGSDQRDSSGPLGIESRTLTIHTVLKVRHDPATDGLSTDTVFNAIEEDLHKAVMADRSRGGLAEARDDGTQFQSSEPVDLDEAGGRAAKDVIYTISYRHVLGDMTTQ